MTELRRELTVLTMIVILAITSTASAGGAASEKPHTTARQGESKTEFRSPMILDTPFFIAPDTLTANDTVWVDSKEDIGIYHCDNVSISALRMKAKVIDETAFVWVKMTLKNRRGHDKSVTVDFEIVNGDDRAASARLGPIKVEEPDSETRAVEIRIPRAKLISDPISMIRITISAIDD